MLKTRILTGAVITLILSLTVIFSHISWVLPTVTICLCLQSIYELYRATYLKDNKPVYYISCALAILFSIVMLPGAKYITAVLFVMAVVLFAYLMKNVKIMKGFHPLLSVLIAVMIIFFFGAMSGIRDMENGAYLLGLSILTPVITDIAAYFVGKGLGKHKLAPIISPKKTIEGCIGGTVTATVILMLVAMILQKCGVINVRYGVLSIYIILASLVGQFGDLALSAVKRIVKIKDYGELLPGHGGVLDRFDSTLFVLPFTFIFCQFAGTLFI